MDCVDIVLATYNGENYLLEQIESLIAQTYKNWNLLVSDDGSDDRTVEILKLYANADSRIHIVNTERQGGVVNNFAKGLSFCSSPYIMFCDQDDIWHPDKVAHMLGEIKKVEVVFSKKTPILGFSDLSLVNEIGAISHESFYQYNKLCPENNLDYRYLAWRSTVYGCTCIFNVALLQLAMPLPINIPMHDQWFALNAAKFGYIFYSPISKIYYRQHSNNVVGGVGRGFWGKLLSVKKLILSIHKMVDKCMSQWDLIINTNRLPNEAIYRTKKDKLNFILKSIIPYWGEKKIYSVVFVLILILS